MADDKLILPTFDELAIRPISNDELLYLLDRCPFLQIVSTSPMPVLPEAKLITAKRSQWVIQYHGDAMSSSPGERLFPDDAETDTGTGTIVRQAYDTAAEMIRLAQQFGWGGVKFVDGHPLMIWAAWMQASDDGFYLEGYTPTDQDLERRARVKRSEVDDQVLQQPDFRMR